MWSGSTLRQPISKQAVIFNGQTIDGGAPWELPYPIEFTQGYDSYLKARQTGVPHRDHSLKHTDPYVRMVDAAIPFPERTALSEPPKLFGPAPDKSFAMRYSEIAFNGVLKPGRTVSQCSGRLEVQRTFAVSYTGMERPLYVQAEDEAGALDSFNTIFPDKQYTDVKEDSIVILTAKAKPVRKRGSITVTSGELTGQKFLEHSGCWIQKVQSKRKTLRLLTQEEEEAGEKWLAKKEKRAAKLKSAVGSLRCVFCRHSEIAPEEFLLCTECAVTHNTDIAYFEAIPNIAEYDWEEHAGFLWREGTSLQHQGQLCIDGMDRRFSDQEPQKWESRSLGEWELAVILCAKYPNFTQQPAQRRKAQRAAAQLVGHFLCGHSFAEIAEIVPKATEESVRKFCGRVRREYSETLIKLALTDPTLAESVTEVILRTGLLRNLYPGYAMTGTLV